MLLKEDNEPECDIFYSSALNDYTVTDSITGSGQFSFSIVQLWFCQLSAQLME